MRKLLFILLLTLPLSAQETHLRWEKNGRTFARPNGQQVYKSAVGQENVEVAPGQYAPYRWDAATKTAYFADMQLRFVSDGWELWRNGESARRMKGQFHPEVWDGTKWVRQQATQSAVSIQEIKTDGPVDRLQISYTLTTRDQEQTITLQVGGSHQVRMSTRIRAKTAGRHRAAFETDLDEIPTAIPRQDHFGKELPPIAYEFSSRKIRWKFREDELSRRTISTLPSLSLRLEEGDYQRNEERIVSPDTWGPTDIPSDADDGNERSSGTPRFYADGYYAPNLHLSIDSASLHYVGFRWTDINLGGAPSSIDAGTQVVCYNGNDNSGSGAVGRFKAEQSNAPAALSDSARLADRTYTTAYTDVNFTTSDITVDVQSVIQELIDNGYSYSGSGDHIVVSIYRQTGQNWWSIAEDYGKAGGDETTLTIVYTPGGGGGPAPAGIMNNPLVF